MNNPRPNTVTPAELLQWNEMGILELSPKFQRREVWTLQQKSYLIDTMLRLMPVPPIYFRNTFVSEKKKLMREVIDGQQRMRTVIDFVEDKFALSKTLEEEPGKKADYALKKFSALSKKQQETILSFTFTYQAFEGITDPEVYEVFRRMNTFSSPLTKQELRHGQYFGYFSHTCESLASEHLEFWRNNKIIREKNIARMGEVEFTASLLATQIEGLHNGNEAIERLYPDLDERFPGRAQHEKRFRTTIDQIVEAVGDDLVGSMFRKPPLFYTLFCVVFHRMFGIPGVSIKSPKRSLTSSDRQLLAASVSRLSEILIRARALGNLTAGGDEPPPDAPYPTKLHKFVVASFVGTTNELSREIRLKTLYRETFK